MKKVSRGALVILWAALSFGIRPARSDDFGFTLEERWSVPGRVQAVVFAPGGDWLGVVVGRETVLFAPKEGHVVPRGRLARAQKEILDFAVSPDGTVMAQVDAGGNLYLYDSETLRSPGPVRAHTGKAVAVSFTGDGKYVLTGGLKGEVKVWTTGGVFFSELSKGHDKEIVMIAGLPTGRKAITVAKDRRVILWDVDTQRALRPTLVDMDVLSADVAGGGNVLALGLEQLQGNLFSGLELHQKDKAFSRRASPHETETRDTVRLIDAEKGTRMRDLEGSDQELRTVGVTPDGRFVAAAGSGASASIWDAATGKLVTTIPFDEPATALAFSPNGRWLATGTREGSLSLYSLTGVGPVVIPAGAGKIIVVVIEPEAVGRSAGAVPRVATASLRVRGRIKSAAPIQSLQVDGRDVTAISPTDSGDFLFTAHVRLPSPGRHQVDIVVEDQKGTTAHETFEVERAAEIVRPSPGEGRRIALVVGVSRYADPSINLQYAANDAEALYELLTSAGLGPAAFRPEEVRLLLDEEATVANVNIGIRQFLQRARENDFVLVFFAGHGMPDPHRLQDLYLIAHDTSPRDVAGTGILMRHVREAIAEVRARDVLVLVDSCHSAGVGAPKSFRSLAVNPIHQAFLDKLRHSSGGMTILTASEAAQYSLEDAKWRLPALGKTGEGHGVFTYFLLKGLLGEADGDRDEIVTVGEVVEYVRDHVRDETGGDQIPAVGLTSFDRELPLSIVDRR